MLVESWGPRAASRLCLAGLAISVRAVMATTLKLCQLVDLFKGRNSRRPKRNKWYIRMMSL